MNIISYNQKINILPIRVKLDAEKLSRFIDDTYSSPSTVNEKIRNIWNFIYKIIQEPYFKNYIKEFTPYQESLSRIYKQPNNEKPLKQIISDFKLTLEKFSNIHPKVKVLAKACKELWRPIIKHIISTYRPDINQCLTNMCISDNPKWRLSLLSAASISFNQELIMQFCDSGAELNSGIVHDEDIIPPPLFASLASNLPMIEKITEFLMEKGANILATYFDRTSRGVDRRWWLARPEIINCMNGELLVGLLKNAKELSSGEQLISLNRKFTVVDEIFYNTVLNKGSGPLSDEYINEIKKIVVALIHYGIDMAFSRQPLEEHISNLHNPNVLKAVALSRTVWKEENRRLDVYKRMIQSRELPYVSAENVNKCLSDSLPNFLGHQNDKKSIISIVSDYHDANYYDANRLSLENIKKIGCRCFSQFLRDNEIKEKQDQKIELVKPKHKHSASILL